MDNTIALAIYIGKLEARVERLEGLLAEREQPISSTAPEDGRRAAAEQPAEPSQEAEERLAEKRFQEGMDSILSYEWPVKKVDADET